MTDTDQPLPLGTFVYDATDPWDALRSGVVQSTADGDPGVWFARRSIEELKKPPVVEPLSQFTGELRPHVLICALRGPADDGFQPLRDVYAATFRILREATDRVLALDDLRLALKAQEDLYSAAIDDVLRMMGSMGVLAIDRHEGNLRVAFSSLLESTYKRRDYLATFTNELMAKSRRIDLLVGHTSTVGSYREELLRGLLEQLLPRRYEATTGFIEDCPRQLDIIIWDAQNYTPLFREQNFVVVPLAAVRAVIEVKTTLSDGPLRKALEILWDTFRNRQTVLPIFKGIFAFEAGLDSSAKVAAAMRSFYKGTDKTGLIEREHGYLWSGINAVCVPGHCLVRERYPLADSQMFPQPILTGVTDPIGDDAYSALFLGLMLSHLEIDSPAKMQNNKTFDPVLSALDELDHGPIYADWRPRSAISELRSTLGAEGANTYVKRIHNFREGRIAADAVSEGLAGAPESTAPGVPAGATNTGTTADS